MLNYFIALLPAFGWGFMPIVANKRKSSPKEQLLGTSISAFFFAVFLFIIVRPEISVTAFFVSFTSGMLWGLGQLLQFYAIKLSSVSKTFPASTGTQLTFTTIFSVIIFKEWSSVKMIIIGISSLIIIISGVVMTGYRKKISTDANEVSFIKLYGIICASSLFFAQYVIINAIFSVSGFQIILPQAIGMLFMSLLVYSVSKDRKFNVSRISFNLITGLLWSIANLGMFLTTTKFGVATSFSISQLCVIVATLGGILIFKEKKSRLEWFFILTGIFLILAGVGLLSLNRA